MSYKLTLCTPSQPSRALGSHQDLLSPQCQGSTLEDLGCRGKGMGRGSHSHGVGGDGVQDDLWGSGWRLRHHIWQQERGVRDLWGHPGGLNPTLHPQAPSSDTLSRAGGHTGPANPAASMGSEEKSHPSTTSLAQIQGFGGLAMHPSPPGETPAPKEKLPESLTWENELLLVLVVMGGCKRGTRVQH